MKKLTKDSVAKSLMAIINSAFILSIIALILLIPGLFIHPDFLIVRLEQFILLIIIIIMIWFIRIIANAFKENLFYQERIVKALQYLSMLLIAYFLVDYGFHLFKNHCISFISTGYALVDIIEIYIKPIRFSLLFLSAISFLLSFVASEGIELKEENNLTI